MAVASPILAVALTRTPHALERDQRMQPSPRIEWEGAERRDDTDVLRVRLDTGQVLLNLTGDSDEVALAAFMDRYADLAHEAMERWAHLKTAEMLPNDGAAA